MNLEKKLFIGGTEYKLVDENVRLELMFPGRANFTLQADTDPAGIVQFEMGLNGDRVRYFTGHIESLNRIDQNHVRVFCRELNAGLNHLMPLSLRHVNLNDVLRVISNQTGVIFTTPEADYCETRIPYFYSMGGGYHVMQSLTDCFEIPRLLWQQQSDGKIWVGSWYDSKWNKPALTIEDKWFKNQGVARSATLPVTPKLRPGVELDTRGVVTSVDFSDHTVKIAWNAIPWTKQLKSW